MKKIINFTSLFVFMVLLVGCIGEEKGHLSRIDENGMIKWLKWLENQT
ncbi:hypothetical protein [Peribacillus frigoritolerans]